jgi:hypothetical protein
MVSCVFRAPFDVICFVLVPNYSNKNIDLIHLQHIWNPYIQVMAFKQENEIPYIITPKRYVGTLDYGA